MPRLDSVPGVTSDNRVDVAHVLALDNSPWSRSFSGRNAYDGNTGVGCLIGSHPMGFPSSHPASHDVHRLCQASSVVRYAGFPQFLHVARDFPDEFQLSVFFLAG